jgi:outer membrane protein
MLHSFKLIHLICSSIFTASNKNKMKNFSVALNGILTIAVAVLFFLHFKGNTKSTSIQASAPGKSDSLAIHAGAIAYVDLDSLENSYTFYKEGKAKMEQTQTELENTLSSRGEKLQGELYELQQKAATMTQSEGEAAQRILLQKRDDLEKYKDSRSQQLQNDLTKFNNDLYAKIDTVLAQYNKDKKFAYILSYRKGAVILYKDKALDVTKDVIEILNKHEAAAPKK